MKMFSSIKLGAIFLHTSSNKARPYVPSLSYSNKSIPCSKSITQLQPTQNQWWYVACGILFALKFAQPYIILEEKLRTLPSSWIEQCLPRLLHPCKLLAMPGLINMTNLAMPLLSSLTNAISLSPISMVRNANATPQLTQANLPTKYLPQASMQMPSKSSVSLAISRNTSLLPAPISQNQRQKTSCCQSLFQIGDWSQEVCFTCFYVAASW